MNIDLSLIGIGTGHPDHITRQGVAALNRAQLILVPQKGEDKAELAELRLRLDITQLPRPFQISALGNKEWSLNSDWKTWQLVLPSLPAVEAK